MNFTLLRDTLRELLQMVIGVVERRQVSPILANVLMTIEDQHFSITATDSEIELIGHGQLKNPDKEHLKITLPGRKLFDICRSLPEGASLHLQKENERVVLRSDRSRFVLATLPAQEFPNFEEGQTNLEFKLSQQQLSTLLQRTHFAMAQQDVRYYLNGMLVEIKTGKVRTVATDGHRFALNSTMTTLTDHTMAQVILPRKGVLELMRLLKNDDAEVVLSVGDNHLRVQAPTFIFTSKLIDGRFPDYERVLPKSSGKSVTLAREELKEALTRAAILSNEKFRAVRLQLRPGLLRILATNPEQEEAEETLSVEYTEEDLDIAFNATYLLDVLNTVISTEIKLTFTDATNRMFIEEPDNKNSLFLVMPLQL